jgi:hypothetical protein
MADEADRADQEVNAAIAEARWLIAHQAKQAPALRPRGACHFCNETVTEGLLFCDQNCGSDFQNEEDQLKRMGMR